MANKHYIMANIFFNLLSYIDIWMIVRYTFCIDFQNIIYIFKKYDKTNPTKANQSRDWGTYVFCL